MGTGRNRRRGSGNRALWNAVFWFSCTILVALLVVAGYFVLGYWKANDTYDRIAVEAFDVPQDDGGPRSYALSDLVVDWEYLKSLNEDIVAWIYMPGTRINYPVVQGDDNDEYLHRDFTYEEGFSARGGAIFMDAKNAPDFSDDNIFIYGHHMNDGSMFACLSKQLSDQSEFSEHHTFYLLTPEFNYECESSALVLLQGSEAIVTANYGDEEAKEVYLSDKFRRSICEPPGGFPAPGDVERCVVLGTCDYNLSNGRAMLFGRVVESAAPSNRSDGESIRTEAKSDAQEGIDDGRKAETDERDLREIAPQEPPEQENEEEAQPGDPAPETAEAEK